MPHLQPSLFQKGEDLPLFSLALEPTRCGVCGSVLVGRHCDECTAELIADPPPDPRKCPDCGALLCDFGTAWQFCPDCHPDNHEPWSTDHTNERS